jgi:uncharacterized membrane protein
MEFIDFLLNVKVNEYEISTIVWNLFLTAVPFLICHFLFYLKKRNWFHSPFRIFLGLLIGFLWFIFLPNTAYVITDIRHIMSYCPKNLTRVCIDNSWMIMFFFTYGLFGWITFVYAIRQMKDYLSGLSNKIWKEIYICLIIPATATGVMLGLIHRYNSWEIFSNPFGLFSDFTVYFSEYKYFINWLIFTLFLFILYFLGDRLFVEWQPFKTRKK